MCGFAGILDPRAGDPASLAELARAMAAPIAHRGPDDEGVFVEAEARLALGFRRLAIRDLTAAGHQPMLSASGRHVVVYNGELYNAEALAADLAAQGVRLRGGSDTEVLLEACERFGVEATLERCLGMFAFALFDRRERRLWLARDRLGKKPLHWGLDGSRLRFASQLKCFFADPSFRPEVDRDALGLYLRLGYVPGARSILAGVHKLEPGHLLLREASGRITIHRYWDPVAVVEAGLADPLDLPEDELLDRFEALLADAVRRRMVADVPLGAFLSGGIDSSTVVALLQAQSPRPVATFTIGSPDPAFDESAEARAVARRLGTAHHELVVGPDEALALVPELPEWFDEPFADSSAIPTLLVARLARRHVTVALSGDGGDELFAGYRRYGEALAWARRLEGLRGGARRAAAALLARVPADLAPPGSALLPARLEPERLGERARRLARLLEGPPERASLEIASHWSEPELLTGRPAPEPPGFDGTLADRIPDLTTRLQLLDLLAWLPEDILTKLDRATMAVSLEARCPLLDHRVVDFVFRLPARARVRPGRSKWLLRRLLARYLPAELVDRPKRGFSVPIHSWLRGPLRDWAEDLLDPVRLAEAGLVDPAPVRTAWRQHLDGRADRRFPLWNLLMLEAWRRRWLSGASALVRAARTPVTLGTAG
ncbi:MAG: asparagine synthetase B [Geminicoccaceae bacterium]|jgi:asparagine synthase (glutamine-hydrolysing)|nr:MAG: asparagine synthetase B [Geminicoccaceae bacterium]